MVKPEVGFVGIDRTEKVLYEVFPYDAGPDYPSEGLFRIVENGKIGYADLEHGAIRIKPEYPAASPFQNGYAQVCPDCETLQDGEYSSWVNGKWGLIGRDGELVLAPQFEEIKQIEPDGRVLVVKDGAEQWVEIK